MLDLSTLGLSRAQIERRQFYIGGSDAPTIVSNNAEKILHLWRQKRGEVPFDDLSNDLPVMMGQYTEPLNVAWFHKNTGRAVHSLKEFRTSAAVSFMACNLDGLTISDDGRPAVLQAKHVNAFSKIEDVVDFYMPQIHHEMAVCGFDRAILSVFIGTLIWTYKEVALDEWYLAQLLDAERRFWDCVQSGVPPVALPTPTPPIEKSALRTVDMTKGNTASEWESLAKKWNEEAPYIASRKKTDEALRAMIAEDIGTAYGAGIEAKRRKDGALVIKADKNGA